MLGMHKQPNEWSCVAWAFYNAGAITAEDAQRYIAMGNSPAVQQANTLFQVFGIVTGKPAGSFEFILDWAKHTPHLEWITHDKVFQHLMDGQGFTNMSVIDVPSKGHGIVLAYLPELGIGHFLAMDNGRISDSGDRVQKEPDKSFEETKVRYKTHFGYDILPVGFFSTEKEPAYAEVA